MYLWPLQDSIVTLSVIAAAVIGKWQVANLQVNLFFLLKLRVGGFFCKLHLSLGYLTQNVLCSY